MSLSNFLNAKYNVVSKRKIFFLVPVILTILAIVAGFIYGILGKGAINLGMDFSQGYSFNIRLATRLDEDNFDNYVKQIEDVFKNLEDDDGEKYGLSVSTAQLMGSNDASSILIRYKAVSPKDNSVDKKAFMDEEVNAKLEAELNSLFSSIRVTDATISGQTISLVYSEVITAPMLLEIKQKLAEFAADNNLTINSDSAAVDSQNSNIVTFTTTSDLSSSLNSLKSFVAIGDTFAGRSIKSEPIEPVIDLAAILIAILSFAIILTLILVYLAFRFSLSQALLAGLAFLSDLLIMFALTVIFHIEINAAFIAAIGVVLALSIISTVVVFDKIRELLKQSKNATKTITEIANIAVNENLSRTFTTFAAALITVVSIMAIAMPIVRMFALPLIFGVLGSVYSSVFLTPSAWAVCNGLNKKVSSLHISVEKKAPQKATVQE